MAISEKLEMYRAKKQFIENLNEVFQIEPKCGSIRGVTYEVYQKSFADVVDLREWVVVHFDGGGRAPRLITCNSNTANFRVIGAMLDGGCYEQVETYNKQSDFGYERVDL